MKIKCIIFDSSIKKNTMKKQLRFRIQNANGTLAYVGTGADSWFTLEHARKICKYEIGQRIVEHNGVDILWEVL